MGKQNPTSMTYAIWEYSVRRKQILEFREGNGKIASPESVVNLLVALELHEQEQEHFLTIILDTKFRIKGFSVVCVGVLNNCQVHPREVFRVAILLGASCIVVAHNHPSGDPTPSSEDIARTQELISAGRVVGIEVVDHVILGWPYAERRSETYVSFREEHLLDADFDPGDKR